MAKVLYQQGRVSLLPMDSCEGDLSVCGRAEMETLMTLVSSVCELAEVLAGIVHDPC